MRRLGGKVAVITRAEQSRSTVAPTVEKLGKLGILVNNAGIMRDRTLHDLDDERSGFVLDVALRTAFQATVAATPPMRESAKRETPGRGTPVYRRRVTFTASSAAIVCSRGARCL